MTQSFQGTALQKLRRLDPSKQRLVRMTRELPQLLNPFIKDGVAMKGALLYGETFNSKVQVAYQMILKGIESGQIIKSTTLIAASSGNTGLGVAQICKMLGLKCRIIMSNDVPAQKVGLITAMGDPIEVVLHTSKTESTVERARREGALDGNFDTDQYANPANIEAQYTHLAPQLWKVNKNDIDVVVVASGTLGTAGGIKRYIDEHAFSTKTVLAVCAPNEEVPGARTKDSIRRDVTTASLHDFKYIECGERYQSFLGSYALQAVVPLTPPGPTSGLALVGALRFIRKIKKTRRDILNSCSSESFHTLS